MQTRIPLYKGKGHRAEVVAYATVDEADLPLLGEGRWHLKREPSGLRYAIQHIPDVRAGRTRGYRQRYLHRVIAGVDGQPTPHVDHRDGDGLNNTRDNVRLCTHAQNMQNRRQRRNAARFRGVQQLPSGRWRARFGGKTFGGGKQVHIGTFDTEVEAALAAEEYRKQHAPFAEPDPALEALSS